MSHQFSDVTLQRTAEYVQKVFQMENSTVFRIGGDEFAVITTGMTDGEIAAKLSHSSLSGREVFLSDFWPGLHILFALCCPRHLHACAETAEGEPQNATIAVFRFIKSSYLSHIM